MRNLVSSFNEPGNDLPIRAYSDSALVSSMMTTNTDIIGTKPMRSSITSNSMNALVVENKYKSKKSVSFDTCVRVVLITSRVEYCNAGLYPILWYKKEDYTQFRKDVLKELTHSSLDILRTASSDSGDSIDINDNNRNDRSNVNNIKTNDRESDERSSENDITTIDSSRRISSCESGLHTLSTLKHVNTESSSSSNSDKNDSSNDDSEENSIIDVRGLFMSGMVSCIDDSRIECMVRQGEDNAKKQAMLSQQRRLMLKQNTNKSHEYLSNNPLALMCT